MAISKRRKREGTKGAQRPYYLLLNLSCLWGLTESSPRPRFHKWTIKLCVGEDFQQFTNFWSFLENLVTVSNALVVEDESSH